MGRMWQAECVCVWPFHSSSECRPPCFSLSNAWQSGLHLWGGGEPVGHMLKKPQQFRWPPPPPPPPCLIHLILATQRRLQGFFWTLLSLLSLRFQMLFWATWFRGEARPLGGKCEILWSSSTHLWLYKNYLGDQKQGSRWWRCFKCNPPLHRPPPPLPPWPLADQGLKQPMKPSFLPLLSRNMSLASHNVNFRDLGCTLNAPPTEDQDPCNTGNFSLSHSGPRSTEIGIRFNWPYG